MNFFKRADGGLKLTVEWDSLLSTYVYVLSSSLYDKDILTMSAKDVKGSILHVPEPPAGTTV